MWECGRCGAVNETWRHWCRSCSSTQDQSQGRSEPSLAPPPPIAPRAADRRVHPGIIVVVLVAIVAVGAGAYFVVSGGSSSKASPQARADAALLRVEDLPV